MSSGVMLRDAGNKERREARLSRTGERTKSENGFAPETGLMDIYEKD